MIKRVGCDARKTLVICIGRDKVLHLELEVVVLVTCTS